MNGNPYSIPAVGERQWGLQVSNFLIATAAGTLQKSGGSFILTAEVDLGSNYGLKVPYIKTGTANPSTSGMLRLTNDEGIGWRNQANSANLVLKVNSSDKLDFGGAEVALRTDKLSAFAATTSAELKTVISDETGSGALVFGTSPTIASATLTSPALGTPASGVMTNVTGLPLTTGVTGTLPIGNGGTGQTGKTAAFDALSPNTTKGDITARGSSNNERVAVGSDGQVLTADSASSSGIKWSNALSNPMTTQNDIIVGGSSGVATRLAKGSNLDMLYVNSSGNVVWGKPDNWEKIPLGSNFSVNSDSDLTITAFSKTLTSGKTYRVTVQLAVSFSASNSYINAYVKQGSSVILPIRFGGFASATSHYFSYSTIVTLSNTAFTVVINKAGTSSSTLLATDTSSAASFMLIEELPTFTSTTVT